MGKYIYLLLLLTGFSIFSASGQVTNDYRSSVSGSWNTLGTWQRFNGAAWVAATAIPNSGNAQAITILLGTTVNVPAAATITADQLVVAGTLQINATGTLIIAAGAGTDMTLSTGALSVSGTLTLNNNATTTGATAANTSFLSGSRYRHLWTSEGTVPIATWSLTSTMEIAGFNGLTSFTNSNWSQNFGHVEVNLPASFNNRVEGQALLNNIGGNLIFTSTGTGTFRLVNGQVGATITIGGSLLINNASQVRINYGNTPLTIAVAGAFSIANTASVSTSRSSSCTMTVGSFSMSSTNPLNLAEQNGGSTTLNVQGNFSLTAGTITKVNNGSATINFTGSSTQTYLRTAGTYASQAIAFNIPSGAIVDAGTSSFGGTGTFTLSGTLRTASPTGLNGTLGNSGAKTFNSNSTIEYNGSVAQVMGGLYPAAPASSVHVIINNPSGVSTSSLTGPPAATITSVTGNLNLQSGTLTVAAGHTLQLNGTLTQSSGVIDVNSIGNLIVNGTGALGADPFPFAGDQVMGAFTLNRSGANVSLVNNVTINNAFTLSDGVLDISGISLTMNNIIVVTSGQLFSSSTSTLSYQVTGTVDPFVFAPGGNVIGTLEVNRPTTTIAMGGDFTIASFLNVISGTLDGGTLTITMQGTAWDVNSVSGGLFDPGTSTVIFDGNTALGYSTSFHNVQLNNGAAVTFPADLIYVSGNLDFDGAGTFDPSTGTVVLEGSNAQLMNPNGQEFYTVQINKASGAVTLNSSLLVQYLLDIQSATILNTNGNLTVLSRDVTTDQDGAIGPVATGAIISGNVTTQRYMDPLGTTYRYVSAPASGVLPPVSWGNRIYYYQYTGASGNYKSQSTASPLQLGTGYAVQFSFSTPLTWSVSGPVHTGSYTWNFSTEGWYLLGNPYPSAIRWYDSGGLAWTLNNVSTTIAVTDNSVAGYPNYFRYWSYNPLDNPGDWGAGELTNGMVAMGQAFWVYVGAGGGSLTIEEQAKERVLSGEFLRQQTDEDRDVLRITLDNGTIADVAYLKIKPKASSNYEFRYDLKKLRNPEMNVFLGDDQGNQLVISAIDTFDESLQIPVGITVVENGTYTLSFQFASEDSSLKNVNLIDRYEGKVISLTEASYSFMVNDSRLSREDRFYLSRQRVAPEMKLETLIETYPNPVTDQLRVTMPREQTHQMQLIDPQGRILLDMAVNGSLVIDMTSYSTGMFILKITSSRETIYRKIVRRANY